MNRLAAVWRQLAGRPRALLWLLLLAAVLHSGTSIQGGLYADDYIQRAFYHGSQRLAEKGLLDGSEPHSLRSVLLNQFNFFDPASANYPALKEFGLLPWWTGDNAMLHFFRPLASLTHYLDYRLWPDSSRMMHLVSLLWYLLGLLAVYRLYRGVGVEKSIALLALLLVMLDQSVFQVVTWIASRSMLMVIAIGFFTVYAYHRSINDKRWYIVALAGLLASLLSAEGAIGICAYLGAYLFTLDQRRWPRRILHILPFALLTLAWHGAYQQAGFGAYGVDFYLDPGREPLAFLQQASYRLPGNFFELASGVDFFSGQVRPDVRYGVFAVAGLVTLAALLWLLWPQLRRDRVQQFFLLAALFALVPGLTIALAPRVMILPFVGFAVLLAGIMAATARGLYHGARQRLGLLVSGYSVVMHLLIAAGLALFMTGSSIRATLDSNAPRGHVELGVDDFAGRHLVIVNSLRPFWLAFVGHQLDYNKQDLPQSLRVLSSAMYPLSLSRIDQQTLELSGEPAIQLDREPLTAMDDKPLLHFIYLTQQLLGLVRAGRDEWQVGQQYVFDDMTITVAALHDNKPQRLRLVLQQPLADYRWVYWDIDARQYQPLALPSPGESLALPGVFGGQ